MFLFDLLMLSSKKIVNTIKSLITREIIRLHPEVKRFYKVNFGQGVIILILLGQYANEEVIKKCAQESNQKNQKINLQFKFL